MASLPKARVSQLSAFSTVGIDFTGPLEISSSHRKNASVVKAYVCIFVCFTVKAVHLELITKLTASSFLHALKIFVARRGLLAAIHSDNAKTFVSANKQIQCLFDIINEDPTISKYCADNRISWKFIGT